MAARKQCNMVKQKSVELAMGQGQSLELGQPLVMHVVDQECKQFDKDQS